MVETRSAALEPEGLEGGVDARLATRYELWDDLSDAYRESVIRIAAGQALAEFVGVLPIAEWLPSVPDFVEKQMLTAKVQDEVGHGHVTARVAEDLGFPRERILLDFVEGRSKLLNIFHFGFSSWEELGVGTLCQNSAAIVQFQSLKQGTYLPYARALKKIETEESFHYHRALEQTQRILGQGTPRQHRLVNEAAETWLVRLLGYFGPPDSDTIVDNPVYQAGLKVDSNDDLRQRWLTKIMRVFGRLGITIDPGVVTYDEQTQTWTYADLDWPELKRMLKEGGPRHGDWVEAVKRSLEKNRTFAQAALASSV